MIAATEATPGTGTVNVAFPQDDRYARLDANDSIKITKDLAYVLGVYSGAISTGGNALLRQPGEIDKAFIKSALLTSNDNITGWHHHYTNPIPLKVGSKLQALSVNATDEDTLIGIALGTGYLNPQPAPVDEIITGYADVTITALTWHPVTINWNQDLKNGTYSIVGMRGGVFLAANAWAAMMRVSIPGNPTWKPGVPCNVMQADHEEYQLTTAEPWKYWGDIGVTFKAPEQMPNVEVCSPAAHTDENVQLMLRKVG